MKAGVTTSVIAHATLLALAFIGLGAARPLEPEVVESIAVELVPISDVTNIRMGSLDSTIVETETPAVVETQDVASLAQNTGNTQEDQVTPTPTERATPAPVVNTAPEPVPDPVEEPDPTPLEETPPPEPAQPAADPEPAPVEEAPPTEVATETPAEPDPTPVQVAPKPMMRPAALLKAPAKPPTETKVAAVTPTPKPAPKPAEKPAAKKPANENAKPADQVAALINNETSRGATTGQGGSPTLGKNSGRASTLTQSQLDGLVAQIKGCFNVPAGAAEANLSVTLLFSIGGDGRVAVTPRVQTENGSGSLARAYSSAAQRAVMRCGPYTMATSQDVQARFDAVELL